MKKTMTLILLSIFFVSSCLMLKETIRFDQLIEKKKEIDSVDNLAKRHLLTRELSEKHVKIENILVKDIIPSTHIDYDFCVVADITVDEKDIECYIYSQDIRNISRLTKGQSRINIDGEFGRFLAVVNGYYTRVEIMKSTIKIKEDQKIKSPDTTLEDKE